MLQKNNDDDTNYDGDREDDDGKIKQQINQTPL